MYKENIVYTYDKILFSSRKEGHYAICYNMIELGGHSANEDRHKRTNTA